MSRQPNGNGQRRLGRKPKPYVTSWNETINGLRRRPSDGRWELADGRTFVEPDEEKTIERFRQLSEGRKKRTSTFISVSRSIDPAETTQAADTVDSESSLALVEHDDQTVDVGFDVDNAALWRYVVQEIRERPKWVAEQTGIGQIS